MNKLEYNSRDQQRTQKDDPTNTGDPECLSTDVSEWNARELKNKKTWKKMSFILQVLL